MNIEAIMVGYEKIFNTYLYRHESLRIIEKVGADILKQGEESDALIKMILST